MPLFRRIILALALAIDVGLADVITYSCDFDNSLPFNAACGANAVLTGAAVKNSGYVTLSSGTSTNGQLVFEIPTNGIASIESVFVTASMYFGSEDQADAFGIMGGTPSGSNPCTDVGATALGSCFDIYNDQAIRVTPSGPGSISYSNSQQINDKDGFRTYLVVFDYEGGSIENFSWNGNPYQTSGALFSFTPTLSESAKVSFMSWSGGVFGNFALQSFSIAVTYTPLASPSPPPPSASPSPPPSPSPSPTPTPPPLLVDPGSTWCWQNEAPDHSQCAAGYSCCRSNWCGNDLAYCTACSDICCSNIPLTDDNAEGTEQHMCVTMNQPPSPPSPPSPPPSPPPPAVVVLGSSNQDPHLRLPYGGKTDFRGEDKTWFSFLSAPNVSVNVYTEAATFTLNRGKLEVDGSFITKAAVVARLPGGKRFHALFNATATNENLWSWRLVEGECEKKFSLGPHMSKTCGSAGAAVDLSSANFTLGDFVVTFKANRVFNRLAGATKRVDLSVRAVDAASAAVNTHGILGQAFGFKGPVSKAEEDVYPIGGKMTTKAQAGGVIAGKHTDYVVASAFSTDFVFSRFNAPRIVPSPNNILLLPLAAEVDDSRYETAA